MLLKIAKLLTTLGAAALLASCGGGSSSTTVPAPSPTVSPGAIAIKVSMGARSGSSTRRSPKQITTDVTALQVTVNSTNTLFELSPTLDPRCTTFGSQAYTCSLNVATGTYNVDVTTEAGGSCPPTCTAVGYSVFQNNVSVAPVTSVALSFTLTPVATSFATGFTTTPTFGTGLPEDGPLASHPVALVADVLTPNGQDVYAPIDNVNLFGTVTVTTTTTPSYTVTAPAQQISATAGEYVDGPYTFTYDGTQISGDQLTVQAAYTQNNADFPSAIETAYNAVTPSTSQILSIPLTRLQIPTTNNPSNATQGGSVYDPTNSWYYIAPTAPEANNSSSATVNFNNAPAATTSFVLNVTATNDTSQATVSGTCSTAGTGSTPIYTIGAVTGSPNGVTPITIKTPTASGQVSSCVLTATNGTFPTLHQSVTVSP
jgi:hypothetical protein